MNTFKTLAITALSATTTAAWAAPGEHCAGGQFAGERQARHEQVAEQLQLTEQQRQAFDAMQQSKDWSAMREQRNSQREAMDALMAKPEFDRAQAQQLMAQHSEQMQQQRLAQLEARHRFMQSLTPQQREQWQQLRANKRHGGHGANQ